jgi:hypothetical protein
MLSRSFTQNTNGLRDLAPSSERRLLLQQRVAWHGPVFRNVPRAKPATRLQHDLVRERLRVRHDGLSVRERIEVLAGGPLPASRRAAS